MTRSKQTFQRLRLRTNKQLTQFFGRKTIRRVYKWGALAILLGTTIYWSLLGAHLHSANADQLIDGYLFADSETFDGALFPSAHSMLLKWPLFWLVGTLGAAGWALTAATVIVSLATIASLAWVLSRIERRPLVLGTWYLALASVLLMVPLQAYSGGILPVQLAMLTTRNIEYIVYIAGLVLLLRAKTWRTPGFVAGIALLGLLAASDRLFLGFGLGAATLMIAYGWVRRNNMLIRTGFNLFAAQCLVVVVSVWVITGLQAFGLIASGDAQASPYQLIDSAKELVLATLYGALGILTNFGANPAFDTNVVRDIVSTAFHRLWSVLGISYTVNIAITVFVAHRSWQVIRSVPYHPQKNARMYPLAALLSFALLCSALTATALFVMTKHYYAVDARYLTIWLFAGFIAAATAARSLRLRRSHVGLVGIVLVVTIPLSMWGSWLLYSNQSAAYSSMTERNRLIAQTLSKERLSTLVGDYWRVVPIRATAETPLTIAPLGNCTDFRDALTSSTWQNTLRQGRVTYLLSLEKGLTDFPACDYAHVVTQFGEPSRTITIASTGDQPNELLLVYDHGFRNSATKQSFLSVRAPTCTTKTIMQVVAHPDDDLLFLSPDLLHDIKAGDCVRTVYLTAGDGGGDARYWRSRQAGARAAYNNMLGSEQAWKDRIVYLSTGQALQLSSPVDNPRITLVFINLPDGNPHGQGYSISANTSLQKLHTHEIQSIEAMGSRGSYRSQQITSTLVDLMAFFKPADLRTFGGTDYDHSDHLATGSFTQDAWDLYNQTTSKPAHLQTYLGYSTYTLEQNVWDDDLAGKEAAFFSYGAHDAATCTGGEFCMTQTAYGVYLTRQYRAN